jgi:exopolysaccharide biosynthesis polyprenyl glycosylphosphotransferase
VDAAAAGVAVAVLVLTGTPVSPTTMLAIVPLWLALLVSTRSYQGRHVALTATETARRVARAGVGMALTCLALTTVTTLPQGPGLLLVAGAATATSLTPRLGAQVWSTYVAPPSTRRRVVVAGRRPREVAQVVSELRRDPNHAFEVVAVCLDRAPEHSQFGVPVATGIRRVAEHALAAGADAVIALPSRKVDATQLRRIGWELEQTGVQLYVGTPLLDVACGRTTMTSAAGLRMLHVASRTRRRPPQLLKELVERPVAALMLAVLSPLILVTYLAIRLDSPGPALYRQTRIGRDGVGFTMLKFRTMVIDADARLAQLAVQNESDGKLFKMRRDPRITRVGSVLRKYSLDELPQLVNVVRGDMSLVGPRPALPSEVLRYDHDECRRLALKPGLTGLWQVSGRSDLSWEDSVRLDLKYVDNWSLSQDLALLVRTVRAVLSHRGAY